MRAATLDQRRGGLRSRASGCPTRAMGAMLVTALVIAGCQHARVDASELALAAAASESLTVALSDSLAPSLGFVAGQAGAPVEALNACEDRVDAHGWETVASSIVEMELPPGFKSSGQISQTAHWYGPSGWIRASAHTGDKHIGWTGLITSECDVFVSGAPAHIDVVTALYGPAVHAFIQPTGAPAIEVEGQAKTVGGQAQLLHAIRYARISAAWGRTGALNP
jgi:hypothetical protein